MQEEDNEDLLYRLKKETNMLLSYGVMLIFYEDNARIKL